MQFLSSVPCHLGSQLVSPELTSTNLQSARRSEVPVQEAAGGIRVLTQANAGSKQFHVAALLGCRFCRRCNACRLCANRVAIREIEMVFAMHPLMTPFSVVHQSRLPRVRIGPLRTSRFLIQDKWNTARRFFVSSHLSATDPHSPCAEAHATPGWLAGHLTSRGHATGRC